VVEPIHLDSSLQFIVDCHIVPINVALILGEFVIVCIYMHVFGCTICLKGKSLKVLTHNKPKYTLVSSQLSKMCRQSQTCPNVSSTSTKLPKCIF